MQSQGIRVKDLEEQLKQERRAREDAEQRARYLFERLRGMRDDLDDAHRQPFTPPSEEIGSQKPSSDAATIINVEDVIEKDLPTIPSAPDPPSEDFTLLHKSLTRDAPPSPTSIKQRLDALLFEMANLKQSLEVSTLRADSAESERNTLAVMIERIREGELDTKAVVPTLTRRKSAEMSMPRDATIRAPNGSASGDFNTDKRKEMQFDAANGDGTVVRSGEENKGGELAMAQAGQQQGALAQSVPYASMLGVVLLGWGIMMWLNERPKLER